MGFKIIVAHGFQSQLLLLLFFAINVSSEYAVYFNPYCKDIDSTRVSMCRCYKYSIYTFTGAIIIK